MTERARKNVPKKHKVKATRRVLGAYDATTLVGLRTIIHDAAIEYTDEQGEVCIELPKMRDLLASAAITRCLTPIRLRGSEIKAMRRIMGLTLAELANKLDERTAIETISRWESEAQSMGGYAEKLLRLLICENLRKEAPGTEYDASMIANLRVIDPWTADTDYEVPHIELKLIHLKEQASGAIIETWDVPKIAA